MRAELAEIKFFITNSPGYLPDAAVAAEIAAACQAWTDTGAISFSAAADEGSADLVIGWEDATDDAGDRVFDGPGGCIAHAYAADGKAKLEFDAAARWSLQRASYATPEEADGRTARTSAFPGRSSTCCRWRCTSSGTCSA